MVASLTALLIACMPAPPRPPPVTVVRCVSGTVLKRVADGSLRCVQPVRLSSDPVVRFGLSARG